MGILANFNSKMPPVAPGNKTNPKPGFFGGLFSSGQKAVSSQKYVYKKGNFRNTGYQETYVFNPYKKIGDMSGLTRITEKKAEGKIVKELEKFSVKKKDIPRFIKAMREGLQGKKFSSIGESFKRKPEITYKSKDGKIIHVKFGSSARQIQQRKELVRRLTQDEIVEKIGLTDKQKRMNIYYTNAERAKNDGMAGELKNGRSKEAIKRDTKDDYTRLGVSGNVYKVAAGGAKQSTDDSRGSASAVKSGEEVGFGGIKPEEAEEISAAIGVKAKERSGPGQLPPGKSSGGGQVHLDAFGSGEHAPIGNLDSFSSSGKADIGFQPGRSMRIFDFVEYKKSHAEAHPLIKNDWIPGAGEGVPSMPKEDKGRPVVMPTGTLSMFSLGNEGLADESLVDR